MLWVLEYILKHMVLEKKYGGGIREELEER